MKVVNLRTEHYTVYIGRAGQGQEGPFGNPVKLNTRCCVCGNIHDDRGSTLPCYEQHLRARLESSSAFRRQFLSLDSNDVLGCFCKPDACHGDVMVKVWEELQANEEA